MGDVERYVVAIDVGIKNFGICVFDFHTSTVVLWENTTITPFGRYQPANNVRYVRELVARYDDYFREAHAVLVERQMRTNMRIIEAVLHSMYYDKCYIISPKAIKMHYSLSTANYAKNKQRAIEWSDRFVANNQDAFATGATDTYKSSTKRDDMADSLLLVMYYLDTYSNMCSKEFPWN